MNPHLTQTDRTILSLVAAANAQQSPSPSIVELCAATGLVKSAVRFRIERLVRLHYLLPRGRYRHLTLYLHPDIAVGYRKGTVVQFYRQVL